MYFQTMENRTGKREEMETQSEFAEDHFPYILVGVLLARNDSDTQRVCDKVSSILVKNDAFGR